jgi:RNA polymerase-binding transcription factor
VRNLIGVKGVANSVDLKSPVSQAAVKSDIEAALKRSDYKQRLLGLEISLSSHLRRDLASGRDQLVDTAADAGDASVADESESEDFTEAELDATTLQLVQAALRRIENGTFGRCLVDGGPIEPKRLDAIPWTPYCARHQELLEAASRPKPTL